MDVINEQHSILITGGSGFLGRGIIRYLQRHNSKSSITIYSRDEHKHHSLRRRFPTVRTVLGDVRDLGRLGAVMSGHDIVIHAAAMKHIPEAERDVMEAISANIEGSKNVALAAGMTGVKCVIGVSTDKAASPRNAYGATKMLMERTLQEAQRLFKDIRFANVRYGNVISSTGSVVPLFQEQIREHGTVPITSIAMTRFWLSIDGAVELILAAIEAKQRGHTYVPLCGGMAITRIAQAVWEMEGREGQAELRIIGVRPGEKLHETLVDEYEAPYTVNYDAGARGMLMAIPPSLSMTGEIVREVMPYSSDQPAFWISTDDMKELIKDSENV